MTRVIITCPLEYAMKYLCAAAVAILLASPATAQKPLPNAAPPAEGWVVLAVGDYRELRDKAYPPSPPPEPPPVTATISRVEYELNVRADAAVGQARLTVDVFKDGWVSVPMPPGLRVREARLDGRPVTLVQQPEGGSRTAPAILLSKPGRSLVSLDVAVPIAAKAGTETLVLPPSPSPVTRATLSIKAPDIDMTVAGGLVVERTTAADSARFLVCGRASEPLTLSWGRRRDGTALAQPLRLRGSVTELVALGEDSAQVTAQVVAEILQGVADHVTIKVPPGFTANQVSGALVGEWDARGDEIVVTLVEPAEKTVSVTLAGESRVAREGRVQVPVVRLGMAERETGGLAVEVLGAGEITERVPRGLDAADPSDLGPMITARQSPALLAFRSRPQPWDAPRSLDVTVARYTPQAVLMANIEEARYTVLATEDGKTLVEAAFAVRNTQRSFVGVMLPDSSVLWSASVDGEPVRPGRAANGALLLPLLKDRSASSRASAVRLLYVERGVRWPEGGEARIKLPGVDLPVSRSGLVLYYPPRYRVKLEPGVFRIEANPTPPGEVLAGLAGAAVTRRRTEQQFDKIDPRTDEEIRSLVSAYQRASRAGATAGLLPVEIRFPALGPAIFLAAELLPEGRSPEVQLTVKREVN